MALSRVVIARREPAVAIMPLGHGLVVHTLRGENEAPEPEPAEDRGSVIDLMAALKRSLGQDTAKPKRAARKPAAAPARKRA